MIDGAVSVTGTTGELEMYNVRGSVDAQNVSGVTSIESIESVEPGGSVGCPDAR